MSDAQLLLADFEEFIEDGYNSEDDNCTELGHVVY
jgi:hypothetical protein